MMNKVCTRPRRAKPKILKCPTCCKQFKGVTAMAYHIRRKVCEQTRPRRKLSGPPYTCEWCRSEFTLKQTCYVHMMRKACLRFPLKYSMKNQKATLLESVEVTLTEEDKTVDDNILNTNVIEVKNESNKDEIEDSEQ